MGLRIGMGMERDMSTAEDHGPSLVTSAGMESSCADIHFVLSTLIMPLPSSLTPCLFSSVSKCPSPLSPPFLLSNIPKNPLF